MCLFLCVCAAGVSELADEVACLSDSTSEERSLSSYTSESFDDNGKSLNAQNGPAQPNLCIFCSAMPFSFKLMYHRRP